METWNEIGYHGNNRGYTIISPQQIQPNSIMIFLDVTQCNQDIPTFHFCFGRNENKIFFYPSQTYSSAPRQFIRYNTHF